MFDIKGKVALITGGASGLGFEFAKELLKCEARGLTIIDINEQAGKEAIEKIEAEFGSDKAMFLKVDVSNYDAYNDAFKKTIDRFNNIDILINNAGIFEDKFYDKQIAVNFNGTLYGTILGLETYIQKHKSSSEGVIINISSVAALHKFPSTPVYNGTKAAILAMSRAFGHRLHFERTKVKVIALCPGVTVTPLLKTVNENLLSDDYRKILENQLAKTPKEVFQKPNYVAKILMNIITKAKSGSVWIATERKEPYEYIIQDPSSFTVPT